MNKTSLQTWKIDHCKVVTAFRDNGRGIFGT